MFARALEMVDYDIYNLRELNKEPPENEGSSFHRSFKEGVRKDKYKLLYGKAMVNGQPKVYKRYVKNLMGDLMP
jgi:hypothetical protein